MKTKTEATQDWAWTVDEGTVRIFVNVDHKGTDGNWGMSSVVLVNCGPVCQGHKDRAALICKAVNSHDELVRALKPFAALGVSECPHCQGNGLQYPEPCKDACHTCGGTGEVVSQVLPEDVRQARAALQQVKGGE